MKTLRLYQRSFGIFVLIGCTFFCEVTGYTDTRSGSLSALVNSSSGSTAGGTTIETDDFSGAATYSYSIPVPPSKGGVTPNISLNYNSHRRNANSWVGYGWELDLGSIYRTPEENGSIDYVSGNNFEFKLGGQNETLKLVSTGFDPSSYGITVPAGRTADLYQATIESSFNKYIRIKTIGTATQPSYTVGWVVVDKSGYQYTFGFDWRATEFGESTGLALGDERSIFSWKLTEVHNIVNDRMLIRYDANHFPTEVSYQNIVIRLTAAPISTDPERNAYFPAFKEAFFSRDRLVSRLQTITILQGTTRLQQFQFRYERSLHRRIHQLTAIQQFGRTDAESLPQVNFSYYGEDNIRINTTAFFRQASDESFLGWHHKSENAAFVDMDGDGLVDLIKGNDDRSFKVLFNNGNDFVEIPGRSRWEDPFDYADGDFRGRLNMSADGHQWLFLMDVNGDGLPDRLSRLIIRDGDSPRETANFLISLNTRTGWSRSIIQWRDPYHGHWAGTSDQDKGFFDMNGDGLVDRVVGNSDEGYFDVYYNTGVGFKQTAVRWEDPLIRFNTRHPSRGKIYDGRGDNTFLTIRDINGDGLPDRMMRVTLNDFLGRPLGGGFAVFLNKGKTWGLPTTDSSRPDSAIANGFDTIGILDPVRDEGSRGQFNKTHDLMDMNGDGFLDRVEGDPSTCEFRVYYYHGISDTDSFAQLSSPVTLSDPVRDTPISIPSREPPRPGVLPPPTIINPWPACGYLTNQDNDDTYVFFQDFNGDGFPDRLVTDKRYRPRTSPFTDNQYRLYHFELNPITYSDSPSWWLHRLINQPPGYLKSVQDAKGGMTAIEYQPSTWPLIEGKQNHRFLPFNLNVVHKIYIQDTSVPAVTGRASPEATRYPGTRWTTYTYQGGNFYIRKARKLNDDIENDQISQSQYMRFNGFQQVTRLIEPSSGESWTPIKTVMRYHQAIGDVAPRLFSLLFRGDFDIDGYKHFALSGKSYYQAVFEGDREITTQQNTWAINGTGDFNCAPDRETTISRCYPRLTKTVKSIRENTSAPAKVSRIDFKFDDIGNIRQESYFDTTDRLTMTKETEFFPASHFFRPILDRPRMQVKKDGAGVILRKKEFGYDTLGNPNHEVFFASADGTRFLAISREFWLNGNMTGIVDTDNVAKRIGYTPDGLFPETETVRLPDGTDLTTRRQFNTLNGEVLRETGPQGTGTYIRQDAFGRKMEEGVINTAGVETTVKRYQYDFISQTVDALRTVVLQRTQVWEPKPDQPLTNTTPSQITWSDGGGIVLQKCALSERGNYRLIQSRGLKGGREEISTEPIFSSNCNFISSIPADARLYRKEKDFFGRVTLEESPPGDVGSPVNRITTTFEPQADGTLQKTIRDIRGRTSIEVYDQSDRVIRVTDPMGSTVSYRLNQADDLLEISSGGRVINSVIPDLLGRKTEMNDLDMGHWRYEYDGSGRLLDQFDNAGQSISNTYDSIGRVTRKDYKRADGSIEKYEIYTYDRGESGYDVRPGELYKIEEFTGGASSRLQRSTRFSYDPLLRKTRRISRNIVGVGEFHQDFVYDALGRTTETTVPGRHRLIYNFMLNGGLRSVCGNSCDAAGDIYYQIDPATAFSVNGQLLRETYGNGVVSQYDYYPNSHRLQSKRTFLGTNNYLQRNYTYDEASNIKTLTDPLNSQGSSALDNIAYDNLDRLTAYRNINTGRSESLTFDVSGNILTNSSYGSDTYEYRSSRPHAVTNIGTQVFGYDDNGNMITDPYRQMDYNTNNQLVRVTMQNRDVVNYDYDYTGARVLKRTDKHTPLGASVTSTTHYLGDLIEVRGEQVVLNIYAGERKVATRTLGDLSSLTGMGGGSLLDSNIDPVVQPINLAPYLFFILTLLLLAAMRPFGRVPEWVRAPVHVSSHVRLRRTWRSPHDILRWFYWAWRKYALTIQETVFDLPNRRLAKAFTLFLLLLLVSQPMQFAYADDAVPTRAASDTDFFYYNHDDHLGSSALITEGKTTARHAGLVYQRGEILQRFEYAPFGKEVFALNSNLSIDPSYTGQKYDIESGLYYYKARYYNPLIGRFIQADSAIQNGKDLQTYNRYTYVRNNPLKYNDPTGHFFWFVLAAFLGAFLGAAAGAIAVAALTAIGMSLFWATVAAAAIGGFVGGLVSGAITGGLKGALLGALMGAVFGAIGGGAGYGLAQVATRWGAFAIMTAAGGSLSYATGGWKGLVMFGAGLAGGIAGGFVGKTTYNKIFSKGLNNLSKAPASKSPVSTDPDDMVKDPVVKAEMKKALIDGGDNLVPEKNVQEEAGWIIKDKAGNLSVQRLPHGSSGGMTVDALGPKDSVGFFHTHPYGNNVPTSMIPHAPSPADFNSANSFFNPNGNTVPVFIIDRINVMRYDATGNFYNVSIP